ncbi:hypothetical protein DFH27DRAFT_632721 [Peziza echinospora]|nr:hypothetical protein DFH27DRAFT_632721 [Peziza echinospora]
MEYPSGLCLVRGGMIMSLSPPVDQEEKRDILDVQDGQEPSLPPPRPTVESVEDISEQALAATGAGTETFEEDLQPSGAEKEGRSTGGKLGSEVEVEDQVRNHSAEGPTSTPHPQPQAQTQQEKTACRLYRHPIFTAADTDPYPEASILTTTTTTTTPTPTPTPTLTLSLPISTPSPSSSSSTTLSSTSRDVFHDNYRGCPENTLHSHWQHSTHESPTLTTTQSPKIRIQDRGIEVCVLDIHGGVASAESEVVSMESMGEEAGEGSLVSVGLSSDEEGSMTTAGLRDTDAGSGYHVDVCFAPENGLHRYQAPQEVRYWCRLEGDSDGDGDFDEGVEEGARESRGGRRDEGWEVIEVGIDGAMEKDILVHSAGPGIEENETEAENGEKSGFNELNKTDAAGDRETRVETPPLVGCELARAITYPICGRVHSEWGIGVGTMHDGEDVLKRLLEQRFWYQLGKLVRKSKEAGRRDISEIEVPPVKTLESFDMLLKSLVGAVKTCEDDLKKMDDLKDIEERDEPSSASASFGGYDGAFESTLNTAPRDANRHHRFESRTFGSARGSVRVPESQVTGSRSKRTLQHDRDSAKSWLRTRVSRAMAIPEHLKTNEDRLLEWLNAEMEDSSSSTKDEIASLTIQMFEVLNPGSLDGAIPPNGGILHAHTGTYLAAHTALLGILPVVGMGKANCVICKKEVGRLEDGVWWRCKGCTNGKGYICGECFVNGGKCGGGHTVDSIHHHPHGEGEREVGHVLVRFGHTANAEDLSEGSRKTHSEGDLALSDAERMVTPPAVTRRVKSEAEIGPISAPISATQSAPGTLSRGSRSSSSKQESMNSPVALHTPRYYITSSSDTASDDDEMSYSLQLPVDVLPGGSLSGSRISISNRGISQNPQFVFPPPAVDIEPLELLRKYSPPPHVPKPKADSISSMLPGFPTPPPSPTPSDIMREQLGISETAATVGSGSVLGMSDWKERSEDAEFALKNSPKGFPLSGLRDEQENLSDVGNAGWSGEGSDNVSVSSMTGSYNRGSQWKVKRNSPVAGTGTVSVPVSAGTSDLRTFDVGLERIRSHPPRS